MSWPWLGIGSCLAASSRVSALLWTFLGVSTLPTASSSMHHLETLFAGPNKHTTHTSASPLALQPVQAKRSPAATIPIFKCQQLQLASYKQLPTAETLVVRASALTVYYESTKMRAQPQTCIAQLGNVHKSLVCECT